MCQEQRLTSPRSYWSDADLGGEAVMPFGKQMP
jgi:hypothetical protein